MLERLSKISPLTVLAVYLPIIIFFVWKSFSINIPAGTFFVLFLSGLHRAVNLMHLVVTD